MFEKRALGPFINYVSSGARGGAGGGGAATEPRPAGPAGAGAAAGAGELHHQILHPGAGGGQAQGGRQSAATRAGEAA
jgi:hypothetical protein